MILKKWSMALVALLLVAPLSASALGISIANVSSSGASTSVLADGDVLTIDLVVENDGNADVFGLGLGITGYEENQNGRATDNSLRFVGGAAATEIFSDTFIPTVGSFNGLANVNGSAPIEQSLGALFNDPLRISLFNGASLTPVSANGQLDTGIGGDSIANGDVHFRVQFQAVAGINGLNATTLTLNIGTGEFGNVAIGAGGVEIPFSSTSLTVTVVPEPGTALLMGLGLAGLAASRRR